MILLDTSVLVAFLNTRDPQHRDAVAIMRRVLAGEHGAALCSDLVLAEGLTLLQRRPGVESVSRDYAAMFFGTSRDAPVLKMRALDEQGLRAAAELHFERYARGLSYTDCALAVMAAQLGAPIASFDAGFDGIVERVSS